MTTNEKALELHKQWNGKLETVSKTPVKSRTDLALAYTPGVAEPCKVIAQDKEAAYTYTMKANTVAVVSDGSAVLGLGNIGPYAAMPVMEGKAVLFKEFGNVNAIPICLDTQDTEEIIKTVTYLAPGFGGINLEDISAPRCFEIEERLKEILDIPVFHDDQHGTAIVVLAGIINALKVVHKGKENCKIVVNGAGSAGVAITKLLLTYGFTNIVMCDKVGILSKDTKDLNWMQQKMTEVTNPTEILISNNGNAAGSAVTCAMEGTRPMLVEIQALSSKTPFGLPRRMTTGTDYNRLTLLTAVLEKKAGMALYDQDIFVNVAGGIRLNEPAIDLAIMLAIVSSFKNKQVRPKGVIIGEVGLTGEIRGVNFIEKRIYEAEKTGFGGGAASDRPRGIEGTV